MKRGNSLEIWKERYPDIGFFLSFFPYEKRKLSKEAKGLEKWLASQNFEEMEVLYIVGLFDGPLPEELHHWLDAKKQHALIFIEEDLGAFVPFSQENLLNHPQVHFVYARENPIEELAQSFPTDRLAVFVSEGKTFDSLELMRRSAALSALYSDVLYSHLLTANVLKNYQRLPYCFAANAWKGAFQNTPAILCGAGPSLEKSLPALQAVQDRALMFAGGSAVIALTQNGIQPHLAMALDPNEEEWDRLKQSHFFERPFLFAPRLHRHVFATANGPFGFLKTDTGGLVENWLEEFFDLKDPPIGPDLGSEAFSVTTLAVSYASALGCNPIILAGVDLAYSGNKRYATGVEAEERSLEDPRALEKTLMRQDIYGKDVETLLKWVMESDCISAFAKAHPETHFINATEGGIGFDGIENLPLDIALKKHPRKVRDIEGELHQWIQETPLKIEGEKFPKLWEELEKSLQKCELLCTQILAELETVEENGKIILMKSDLAEETAYRCFLEGIAAALDHLLIRYFPHIDSRKSKWQRDIAKFKELQLQIQRFGKILYDQKACVKETIDK